MTVCCMVNDGVFIMFMSPHILKTLELTSRCQLSVHKNKMKQTYWSHPLLWWNEFPFLIFGPNKKYFRIILEGSGDSEFLPLWKILNNGNLSCDVDLNVRVCMCVSASLSPVTLSSMKFILFILDLIISLYPQHVLPHDFLLNYKMA